MEWQVPLPPLRNKADIGLAVADHEDMSFRDSLGELVCDEDRQVVLFELLCECFSDRRFKTWVFDVDYHIVVAGCMNLGLHMGRMQSGGVSLQVLKREFPALTF